MQNITGEQIINSIVTSKEAIQLLGITRSRLCQLVKNGKLTPIKRNLFLLNDIITRKQQQLELRKKFYRPLKK